MQLTNLDKVVFPVAPLLVTYLAGRAMVLKRYPWLRTCAIEHGSGSVIDFPMVDNVAGLERCARW